jgi:hypothetical protein
MATENLWQQAVDLTNRVFQVMSSLNLPRGNYWPTVVTVDLSKANEELDSIRTLLDKGYWDSTDILARALFELAVNLAYIAKDTKKRLPEYLKHGGVPLTNEDVQQLQLELAQEQPPEVKDIVPGQTWRRLKDMCCDLGSQWLKEFETFYRYVSVPSHAGSFTLGKNYKQLLEQQPLSEHQKAAVLITALDFHLRIAEVAADVFPQQIKLKTVKALRAECQNLGQSLAKN